VFGFWNKSHASSLCAGGLAFGSKSLPKWQFRATGLSLFQIQNKFSFFSSCAV